eukprot:3845719-Rhodomonas_salina.3
MFGSSRNPPIPLAQSRFPADHQQQRDGIRRRWPLHGRLCGENQPMERAALRLHQPHVLLCAAHRHKGHTPKSPFAACLPACDLKGL